MFQWNSFLLGQAIRFWIVCSLPRSNPRGSPLEHVSLAYSPLRSRNNLLHQKLIPHLRNCADFHMIYKHIPCVILSDCTFSGWNDSPLENWRMLRLCPQRFQQLEPSVLFWLPYTFAMIFMRTSTIFQPLSCAWISCWKTAVEFIDKLSVSLVVMPVQYV